MNKLIATIAALISLSAIAAPDNADQIKAVIPASEGTVLAVANEQNLWRNVDSPSAYRAQLKGCPIIFCIGVKSGNAAMTDKAIFFVVDGRIVKKIAFTQINIAQWSSFGLMKGIYIQDKDYDASLFTMDGDSLAEFIKLLESNGIKITEYQ